MYRNHEEKASAITAFLTASALASFLAGCVAGEDPLADYEQVDAVAIFDAPAAVGVAPENRDAVAKGEYLVELLGCGSCHTDGALVGDPDMSRWLAGSRVGVAYSNPMQFDRPGVVFPPNITPDEETGIGRWSRREIADAIRAGSGRHGQGRILVMPWQGYGKLTDNDVLAIVGYLENLEPVRHRLPENVPPGRGTSERYVHFGVYRSR